MLRTLLKKQFIEINKGFFFDSKKGKNRTKKGAILYILFYVLILVGLLGGLFSFLAYTLAGPLVSAGFGWLYFLIMMGIALVLGIFGSVFTTYSSLYLSTDNDLLLSMPIPIRYIMIARLMGVYLMDLLYTLIVLIPMTVMYYLVAEISFMTIIGPIVMSLMVTLLVLILSTGLGWVVARLSLKMKNKSIATAIIALAGIGIYYFVYFKAVNLIQSFLANISTMEIEIKGGMKILYGIGAAAAGSGIPLLAVCAVIISLMAMVYIILDRSFIRIVTTKTGAAKIKYREKEAKSRSVNKALLFKEIKHLTSSSSYLLNSSLGSLIMVALAVFLLIKGDMMGSLVFEAFGDAIAPMLPILIAGGACMTTSTNCITAPAVSIEGKDIWISQTLPVKSWQVLRAKIGMHLVFTLIPALLLTISLMVAFKVSLAMYLPILIIVSVMVLLQAEFGLFINLLKPNLKWTSEMVVIKQSLSVAVAMFSGWILSALIIVSGIFLNATLMFWIWFAVIIVLAALLNIWLRGKGSRIFSNL